jgi:hypothetical protein
VKFRSLKPFASANLQGFGEVNEACPDKMEPAPAETSDGKWPTPDSNTMPQPSKPTSLNAVLELREIFDTRWQANTGSYPADAQIFPFTEVYYDSADLETSKPKVSVGLTAAFDTITAFPNSAAPTTGNIGQIRLFVTPGADLKDVVLTFDGAALATVPGAPASTYVMPVEANPVPASSLKITPPDGKAFDGSPIPVDVSLQVVATRVVKITAAGDAKDKNATGGTFSLSLPVTAGTTASGK